MKEVFTPEGTVTPPNVIGTLNRLVVPADNNKTEIGKLVAALNVAAEHHREIGSRGLRKKG